MPPIPARRARRRAVRIIVKYAKTDEECRSARWCAKASTCFALFTITSPSER
jgi:hypothetical protein